MSYIILILLHLRSSYVLWLVGSSKPTGTVFFHLLRKSHQTYRETVCFKSEKRKREVVTVV